MGEGPSTACLGNGVSGEGGQREAGLTPRVATDRTAIAHWAPLTLICVFRLRQGAHASHGRRVHTAPEE